MAEYDLLIKNGTIVDGLRMPAYRGDIGIRGGKVVAMGNVQGSATRVLDATGLIVAPGFMDSTPTTMPRSQAGTPMPRYQAGTG